MQLCCLQLVPCLPPVQWCWCESSTSQSVLARVTNGMYSLRAAVSGLFIVNAVADPGGGGGGGGGHG